MDCVKIRCDLGFLPVAWIRHVVVSSGGAGLPLSDQPVPLVFDPVEPRRL